MTAQLDIDRLLDDFLADGANGLSDHVLDAALGDIDTTRQRRAWRVPRRYSNMATPLRLLAAAAILAATLGGVFVLGSSLRNDAPPTPEVTPAPVITPSPSRAAGGPIALGAGPGGRWEARRPAAFGSEAGIYRLVLEFTVFLESPDEQSIPIGSIARGTPPGELTLGSSDHCSSAGSYRYTLSDDFRAMTVEVVRDVCADRAAVLTGNWVRLQVEDLLAPGESYTFDLMPRITFEVPMAFRNARDEAPVVAIWLQGGPTDLYVDAEDYFMNFYTGGQVQADRCDWDAGVRATPKSFDEFVEWNNAATGLSVSAPVETKVGGYDAVYVDVGGTDDCVNGEIPVDCGCVPMSAITDTDGIRFERTWAVDVNDRIILVMFRDDNPPWLELTPERLEVAQEFVDSITFD